VTFFKKLSQASQKNRSFLCVGLDPVIEKLPEALQREADPLFTFNKAIIDATADLVCAYKPNAAFYEQAGLAGYDALQKTINYIPSHIPVILDVKRSDIGNTAKAYAKAAFEEMRADAVTVNPLLGKDSVVPFLDYTDKGVFVLGLTSNPGADDFEKLYVEARHDATHSHPLYLTITEKVREWNIHNNCGLVVGATQDVEMESIRQASGDMWFLVPGVGAQGGDLNAVMQSATYSTADPRVIINASRSILYASAGQDFAAKAAEQAAELRDRINSLL